MTSDMIPRKILIIRTSSLGDIFHAFPALHAIKRQYPYVTIHWLIKEKFSTLLTPVKEVDKIYNIPPGKNVLELAAFIRNLRNEGYDAVIDFQGLLRTGIWSLLTKCPTRIGFSKKEARHKLNCLFTTIKITPEEYDHHIVQKNLRLLKALGIEKGDPGSIPYQIDKEFYLRRDEFFKKHEILDETSLIGVHIGASWRHRTKCWPISYYNDFFERIPKNLNAIVFWGPDEIKKISMIKSRNNILVAPRLTLLDLAAFIQKCTLFMGSDSGPVHMAAALGIKTLSLMGPTLPARLRPWGPDHHYLYKGVDCSLCLKNICLKRHQCMKAISVEEVLQKTREML